MKRRKFLKNSTTGAAGLISSPLLASYKESNNKLAIDTSEEKMVRPIAVCTWNFHNATAKAWEVLKDGGNSLDAVEQGVMVEEARVIQADIETSNGVIHVIDTVVLPQ